MDSEIDALLDEALQAYTEREAPLGMEARILRRAAEPQRRYWWWVVPALGAVAALMFVLIPEPTLPPLAALHFAPPAVPVITTSLHSAGAVRRVAKSVHIPRIAPPAPVSSQQRALLDLATRYPEQAAKLARVVPEELSISSLNIEPISITPLGQ